MVIVLAPTSLSTIGGYRSLLGIMMCFCGGNFIFWVKNMVEFGGN